MSTSTDTRREHGADSWWGDDEAAAVVERSVARAAARPTARRRRRKAPLWVVLLRLPGRLLGTAMRRYPRLRRAMLRTFVFAVVAGVVAGSVGVILLNNVVIRRTAELGELDQERRELRRENAMLGADAATASAVPRVVKRAERDLGMVRGRTLPTYTYLEPSSGNLTPLQRQRRRAAVLAQRQKARAAAAATAAKADAAASAPKENG